MPYQVWTKSHLPALALELGVRNGPHRAFVASSVRSSAIQYEPAPQERNRAPVTMDFVSAALGAGYQYRFASGRWGFAPTVCAGVRYYGPGLNKGFASNEGSRGIGFDHFQISQRNNLLSGSGFHTFAMVAPEVSYALWPSVSVYGRLPYTYQLTRPDFFIERTVNGEASTYRSHIRPHQLNLELGMRFGLGKGGQRQSPANQSLADEEPSRDETLDRKLPAPEVGVAFGTLPVRIGRISQEQWNESRVSAIALAPIARRVLLGIAVNTGPGELLVDRFFIYTPIWSTSLLARSEVFLVHGRLGSIRVIGAVGARHTSAELNPTASHGGGPFGFVGGYFETIELSPYPGGWVPTTQTGLLSELALSGRVSLVTEVTLSHDLSAGRSQRGVLTTHINNTAAFRSDIVGRPARSLVHASAGLRFRLNNLRGPALRAE